MIAGTQRWHTQSVYYVVTTQGNLPAALRTANTRERAKQSVESRYYLPFVKRMSYLSMPYLLIRLSSDVASRKLGYLFRGCGQ